MNKEVLPDALVVFFGVCINKLVVQGVFLAKGMDIRPVKALLRIKEPYKLF